MPAWRQAQLVSEPLATGYEGWDVENRGAQEVAWLLGCGVLETPGSVPQDPGYKKRSPSGTVDKTDFV